jgi:hypothetical protein
VQDAETQRDIEMLLELVHVERVDPPVLDPRSDEPGDRANRASVAPPAPIARRSASPDHRG